MDHLQTVAELSNDSLKNKGTRISLVYCDHANGFSSKRSYYVVKIEVSGRASPWNERRSVQYPLGHDDADAVLLEAKAYMHSLIYTRLGSGHLICDAGCFNLDMRDLELAAMKVAGAEHLVSG